MKDHLSEHRRQSQNDSLKIIAVSAIFFLICAAILGIIELFKYWEIFKFLNS